MRISGNKHSPYFDPVYSRHPDIKVLLNGYEPRQRVLEACEEEGWIIVYQITANGRIKSERDTVTKRIEPLTETLFGEVKIILPKSPQIQPSGMTTPGHACYYTSAML